jgi:protein disulfide-isomerase-like protein
MSKILLITALFTQAYSLELSHENYDELTAGKTVFLKFFAPWCGHCKALAPAWSKLMDEYVDSATVVVAESDCTAKGKKLCETHGIKGFPSIRFGDPSNLEEYKNGRDFGSLSDFAAGLLPPCNVNSLENCDEQQIEDISELGLLTEEELQVRVSEYDQSVTEINAVFKDAVSELQKAYQKLTQTKDDSLSKLTKSLKINMVKSILSKDEIKVEL